MKNNKDLNSALRKMAIEAGLCEKWQGEWKEDWSLDEMAIRLFRGMDFYLKHRFISNTFFKENFDMDFMRKNGVLVDDTFSLMNPKNAVLIGNSKSVIRINGYSVNTIFVVDDSNVKIVSKNHSFAIVHLLDRTSVEVECNDESKVVVIKHSHDAKITAGQGVTVKEEYDYMKKTR